ncbi:SMR family transporter [Spirochaetota bacterium]
MTLTAFTLIIIAAVLHAIWNFAAKKASGNLSVIYLGLFLACIIFFPFLFILSPAEIFVAAAYPYIIATGIIHALYFFVLAKAYEHGDISIAYPIARGTGIAGTAIAAFLLLTEKISPIGASGILIICIGTVLLGFRQNHGNEENHYKGIIYALTVGIAIMTYSIVDKVAVGIIHPLAYIYGLALLTPVFLTPYMVAKKRREIVEAWSNMKRYCFVIGIGSMGTYMIILFAFQMANVSYVVAVRETSVAIGAFMGVKFLGEHFSVRKVIGVLAIVAGMVLIKLA